MTSFPTARISRILLALGLTIFPVFGTDIFVSPFSTNYATSGPPDEHFYAFGFDPDTGNYFAHAGFGYSSAPLELFDSLQAFADHIASSTVPLDSTGNACLTSNPCVPLMGSYFAVSGGNIFGHSTELTAELTRWLLTDGTAAQSESYALLSGANMTWDGFSGMNVFRSPSGMFLFAKKADDSLWTISQLAADLSISNLQDTPITAAGWAFLVNGFLYVAEAQGNTTVNHQVDVTNGQDSDPGLNFIFPDPSVYISNTFYDPIADRLFLWDRNSQTLLTADNFTAQVSGSIPEPGTLLPALTGLAILFGSRRLRR